MFVGEPEDAMLQLALLESADRLGDVASLTWRDAAGGPVISHRAHGSFNRFPTMPYPAWDLVALERYALPLVNKRYSRGTILAPIPCDFLLRPYTRGTSSGTKPEALVDGIERRSRDRVDSFIVATPSPHAIVYGVLHELIARQLPSWFGNARGQSEDPAFVHRFNAPASGCSHSARSAD